MPMSAHHLAGPASRAQTRLTTPDWSSGYHYLMSLSAVTVFYGRSVSAIDFADAVVADLVGHDPELNLFTRVRGGLLLSIADETSGASYAPYRDGARLQTGSEVSTPWIPEYTAKNQLLNALDYSLRADTFTTQAAMGSSYDCLTFSSIDAEVVVDAVNRVGQEARVEAVATFLVSDPLCYRSLWHSLVPRYMLQAGVVLEVIPDSLADIGFDERGLFDQDWSRRPRRWSSPGYFADEFGHVFAEHRLAHLDLPPDLAATTVLRRPRASPRSPVQRVLFKLPAKTAKLSKIDDPSQPARFQLGDPRWQWPDPDSVSAKIENYYLRVGHPSKKWLGFRAVGFENARPGDVEFLSNSLCSALIDNTFDPFDIRVDADGTLEFAVNVVIPCRYGVFRNVCTAWNAKPGRPVALSSAYVAPPPGSTSCSLPMLLPAGLADDDWAGLNAWVRDWSAQYASTAASTVEQAGGWIWLPHSHVRTRAFAAWCRRNTTRSSEIFRRKSLGGRCTIFAPDNSSITSLGEKVALLRMAQACLGAAGVRGVIELRID